MNNAVSDNENNSATANPISVVAEKSISTKDVSSNNESDSSKEKSNNIQPNTVKIYIKPAKAETQPIKVLYFQPNSIKSTAVKIAVSSITANSSQTEPISMKLSESKSTSTHGCVQKSVQVDNRQNVLEEMKRKIANSFLKTQKNVPETTKTDEKSALVPGTDCEYRTPGAQNLNKNGRIKRPMNAFMVWAREVRGRLALAMPNATNSDISVKLGQLWADLPEEQKKQFYKTAENIKQKHRQDFPDWVYKPSPSTFKRKDSDSSTGNKPFSSLSRDGTYNGPLRDTASGHLAPDQLNTNVFSAIPLNSLKHGVKIVKKPGLSSFTKDMLVNKLSGGQSQGQSVSSAPNVAGVSRKVTFIQTQNITGQTPTQTPTAFSSIINNGKPNSEIVLTNAPHTNTITATNFGINTSSRPNLKSLNSPNSQASISSCKSGTTNLVGSFANDKRPLPCLRPAMPTCQDKPSRSQLSEDKLGQILTELQHKKAPVLLRPLDILKTIPIVPTQISHASKFVLPIAYNGSPVCTFTTPTNSQLCDKNRTSDNDSTQEVQTRAVGTDEKCAKRAKEKPERMAHEQTISDQCISNIAKSKNDIEAVPPEFTDWEQTTTEADDNWPFPFPKDVSTAFVKEGHKPMYMELLEPYDPFLKCEHLYSELYPGSLHLDISRWASYLEEDISDASGDNFQCFHSDEESDAPIMPVPLRDTLERVYNDAHIEESDTGDVITVTYEQVVSISDNDTDTIELSEDCKYLRNPADESTSTTAVSEECKQDTCLYTTHATNGSKDPHIGSVNVQADIAPSDKILTTVETTITTNGQKRAVVLPIFNRKLTERNASINTSNGAHGEGASLTCKEGETGEAIKSNTSSTTAIVSPLQHEFNHQQSEVEIKTIPTESNAITVKNTDFLPSSESEMHSVDMENSIDHGNFNVVSTEVIEFIENNLSKVESDDLDSADEEVANSLCKAKHIKMEQINSSNYITKSSQIGNGDCLTNISDTTVHNNNNKTTQKDNKTNTTSSKESSINIETNKPTMKVELGLTKMLSLTNTMVVRPRVTRARAATDRIKCQGVDSEGGGDKGEVTKDSAKGGISISSTCKRQRSATLLTLENETTRRKLEK